METCTCVLCGIHQVTKQRHDQHVARHLQELALVVLPQNYEDSDDGEHASLSESESSMDTAADDQGRNVAKGSTESEGQ